MSLTIYKRDAINQENIREKFIKFAEENEDKVDISFYRDDVTLKIKKGKALQFLVCWGANAHKTKKVDYWGYNKMISMDNSYMFVDPSYMHDCHDNYISIQIVSTRRSKRD